MPLRRRTYTEPEENPERWMVSYADFITLLFGFFVVMYAISSVNDEKYRVLSATLKQAFDVDMLSPDPIQVGEPTLSASPHVVDLPDSHAYADQEYGDTFVTDPVESAQSLLGGFAHQEGVSVQSDNDWLELSLSSNMLFQAGQAQLSNTAKNALNDVVEVARSTTNPITIEGYTDNIPIESVRFDSNWQLSAARASAVAGYLTQQGIRAERIAAVGYGENHPVETNATPQGRASNRRVVVVLARRSGSARNRNTEGAQAVVRSVTETEVPAAVRTESGGLLFTNEPDNTPNP
ncbi:MAG: OmpA family protein [Pseudomonadota bacterium]